MFVFVAGHLVYVYSSHFNVVAYKQLWHRDHTLKRAFSKLVRWKVWLSGPQTCLQCILFYLGLSHWKRFWLVCTTRSAI